MLSAMAVLLMPTTGVRLIVGVTVDIRAVDVSRGVAVNRAAAPRSVRSICRCEPTSEDGGCRREIDVFRSRERRSIYRRRHRSFQSEFSSLIASEASTTLGLLTSGCGLPSL